MRIQIYASNAASACTKRSEDLEERARIYEIEVLGSGKMRDLLEHMVLNLPTEMGRLPERYRTKGRVEPGGRPSGSTRPRLCTILLKKIRGVAAAMN